MSAHSQIEWTEATWNPVTGCTKISAGCKNCYAERLALRLQAMGNQVVLGGIEEGITLEFIVQAVNGASQSVASDPIVVTTPVAAAAKPAAPEMELAPLAASAPNGNGNGNGSYAVSRLS